MITYDIKVIRSVFKICYYYIMTFIIFPVSFARNITDSVNKKIRNIGKSENDKMLKNNQCVNNRTYYNDLIIEQIQVLRKLLNIFIDPPIKIYNFFIPFFYF